ncbi:MAG: ABC transporter permease [Christensenellales bacterium]
MSVSEGEKRRVLSLQGAFTAFRKNTAAVAFALALVLFIVIIIINPQSFNNMLIGSLILTTTLLSISAAGQTIVLIGGGMDFSVGAVMSAAAIITTYTMDSKDGMFLPVLLMSLGMGAAVGLLNGFFVVRIGLPPMIVTMAVANIVSRMQYVLTAGSPSGYAGDKFRDSVIYRYFDIIPSVVLYAAIIFPLVFWLLQRSRYGKQVYMVGNNRQAAFLSGVKVSAVTILTYVFSGMLSAFAGILGAGHMVTARCDIFNDYAFTSLVAVIVGGTTFSGGIGTFSGTVAGALLMTVLSNLLTTLALPQTLRDILNGVIIILLLMLYNRSKAVRQ